MKDIKEPLVSVIVPSYNHSKYIEECIESIVNQTYTNWELTVIDDGSSDNSIEILKELSNKYNFRVVQQKNRGVSATLNRGIKEFSSGKYFTFCASDDFWVKDKLKKQVHFMECNPEIPMSFGKTYYVDDDSKIIDELNVKNNRLKGGRIFGELLIGEFHPPVNYMFRKEIFKEIGYYDESLFAEDYDMNLRISSANPIGFIDEYLSYYRKVNTKMKSYNYLRLGNSHLKSVEKFNTHHLAWRAKNRIYLGIADNLSAFRRKKLLAIKYFALSVPLIYQVQYWKAFVKFFVLWK